jgi:hypothetical protein
MKKKVIAFIILAVMLFPLICAGASASGGVKLPRGYVTPDKVIDFKNGIDQQDFSRFDGLALTVSSISSGGCYRLFTANGTGENKDEASIFYDDSNGLIVLENGAENEGFTLRGAYSFAHNGAGDHSGIYYEFDYSFEVTAKNIRFSYYRLVIEFDSYQQGYLKKNGEYAAASPLDERKEGVRNYGSLHLVEANGKQELHLSVPTVPFGEDGWAQAITVDFKVEGVKPHGKGASGGAAGYASWSSGEDGGVSVPAAIVVGILGAGAAAVGAAAALNGGDGDTDGKGSTYKMYVQKDFGSAIRRGAKEPSVIRARMAEVTAGGAERDRDDLTAMITAVGDGMEIERSGVSGRYFEAAVRVPEGHEEDSASIIFVFAGEGGSFENRVIFRVVDGPSLKFMEETPEGFTPYHENCGIDAIPGDGFTYTRCFIIDDAVKAPDISDISAEKAEGLAVSFELTGTPFVYKMLVKNETPAEAEHDIFARPTEKRFDISVRLEGEKEPVRGHVGVKLYPEGLTLASNDIAKKDDIKYLYVQAFEKEDAGDLDKKWRVTEMQFILAAKGENGAVIDPKDAKYRFDKLEGAGGIGSREAVEESVAEKFQYKESVGEFNGRSICNFEPASNLVEPEDGSFFMVKLPVACEYGGKEYAAEIPMRLVGKPLGPMDGWDEEYEKLWKRVEKYALPENADFWIKKVQELAVDPPASVEELRLTSKYIVRQYMRYWTEQSEKHRDDAKVFDKIVNYLEWTKFIGDCAFSMVVNAYAGPVAEAIISPTKDFLAAAAGEAIAAWARGESLDPDKLEFSKNVAAMGDNLITNEIDFKNWKKAAAVLGCYFAYASIKNFLLTLNEKKKFDLYGAIVGGFSDMTSAGLKAAASHLLTMLLGSCAKSRKKIGVWFSKFVSDHFGENKLLDLRNYPDGLDSISRASILRKLTDGLIGMGLDKLIELPNDIHDKIVTESISDFDINSDGDVMVTTWVTAFEHEYELRVNLTKALKNSAGGFFVELFLKIFGKLPSADALLDLPKDPKLPDIELPKAKLADVVTTSPLQG